MSKKLIDTLFVESDLPSNITRLGLDRFADGIHFGRIVDNTLIGHFVIEKHGPSYSIRDIKNDIVYTIVSLGDYCTISFSSSLGVQMTAQINLSNYGIK